jgi:prepilin-type N-terminal cleavage/methylation domain-containing protein
MIRRAFSFTECLVVVAIIAILVALLVPAIAAMRQRTVVNATQSEPPRICKVVALKEAFVQGGEGYVFRVHVVYATNVSETPSSDSELVGGEIVDVLANLPSFSTKYHPEIIQANLKVGRWYLITVEKTGSLDNVISVQAIPHKQ